MNPGRRKNDRKGLLVAGAPRFILISAALTSCAAYRVAKAPSLTESSDESRLRVAGYTTTDGRHHSFDGYMRSAGDSITFTAPKHHSRGLSADSPERVVILPRDQVASVTFEDGKDVPKSIGAGILVLGFVALMGLAVFAQSYTGW